MARKDLLKYITRMPVRGMRVRHPPKAAVGTPSPPKPRKKKGLPGSSWMRNPSTPYAERYAVAAKPAAADGAAVAAVKPRLRVLHPPKTTVGTPAEGRLGLSRNPYDVAGRAVPIPREKPARPMAKAKTKLKTRAAKAVVKAAPARTAARAATRAIAAAPMVRMTPHERREMEIAPRPGRKTQFWGSMFRGK